MDKYLVSSNRITQHERSKILDRIVNFAMTERRAALKKVEHALAREVYSFKYEGLLHHLQGKYSAALFKTSDTMFIEKCDLPDATRSYTHSYVSLHLGKCLPAAHDATVGPHPERGHLAWAVLPPTLKGKITNYWKRKCELDKMEKQLRQKLYEIFLTANTYKQLAATWPGVTNFVAIGAPTLELASPLGGELDAILSSLRVEYTAPAPVIELAQAS